MIKQESLGIPDMLLLMNMKALKAEIILCPAGGLFVVGVFEENA